MTPQHPPLSSRARNTVDSPRRPLRRALAIVAVVTAITLGVSAVPRASASHDVPAAGAASSLNLGKSAAAGGDRDNLAWRPAQQRHAAPQRRMEPFQVGTQFHGVWSSYTDAERIEVLDKLQRMGATWVRIDLSWATIQPSNGRSVDRNWGVPFYDKIINMAHRRGLKVLGMLWLTPSWARPRDGERSAPTNPADYGRALGWAAKHWQGKVQAWEVWNEPNSRYFFASESPREYVGMLCSGFRAVQRSGSTARVVFGGTVHNDVDWIRRAYDAGAKGCFDRMATHPYPGPSNASPTSGGADDPWDFNRLRAVRKLMLARGDRKPIWATELGWSSHANSGGEQAWNMGVSEQQQARYTVLALRQLRREHPYVTRAFIYNEREKETSDVHQNGFGIMRTNLAPKPVYGALRDYLR